MAKKNYHHKKHNSNTGLKFTVGIGLVLVGFAAFFMLLGAKNTETSIPEGVAE